MSKTTDPLASVLLAARPEGNTQVGRVVQLFGHRPDVLKAIIVARRDNRLGWAQIAKVLSTDGTVVRPDTVKSWCATQGVD